MKIELGEVYGRDVSFSYLKPTIQAYGLQGASSVGYCVTKRSSPAQRGLFVVLASRSILNKSN